MFRIFKTLWRGLRGHKQEELHPFKPGDVVRLKHRNPFKGTLSADNLYIVKWASINYIYIRADNFTVPYFDVHFFELASNPIHKGTANRWSHDWKTKRQQFLAKKRARRQERRDRLDHCNAKAEEYEQAIKAQEMIGEKV